MHLRNAKKSGKKNTTKSLPTKSLCSIFRDAFYASYASPGMTDFVSDRFGNTWKHAAPRCIEHQYTHFVSGREEFASLLGDCAAVAGPGRGSTAKSDPLFATDQRRRRSRESRRRCRPG